MATRAGAIGNLPWVRGTSFPGVKMAPRGAQHKEAITAELQMQMKNLGIKKFIETYGSSTFQSISPAVTGGIIGYEASKFAFPTDEKDKEQEVSTQVEEQPPKLPEEPPKGPDIGTELATEAAIKTTEKLLEKKDKPEFGKLTKAEKQTALALKEDQPDFYSRAIESIKNAKPDKLTKTKWKSYIQSTKDEMDYLGLTEFLQGNESITKKELLDFVEGKNIAPNITVRSIPKDEMNKMYEGYSLGGYTADDTQEHIVFQIDIPERRDVYGNEILSPEKYFLSEHFNREYGSDTFAHARVQVGYEPSTFAEIDLEKGMYEEIEKAFKNTLIIDEIQSDWLQKGQDEGFVSDFDIVPGDKLVDYFKKHNISYKIDAESPHYQFQGGKHKSIEFKQTGGKELASGDAPEIGPMDPDVKYIFRKSDNTEAFRWQPEKYEEDAKYSTVEEFLQKAYGKVPDFPIKESKKWVELVLNKMIEKAILDGRDSIAITNGEIQYNRYDAQPEKEKQGLKKFYNTIVYDQLEKIAKKYNVKLERIDISEGEAPKELQDIHLNNQIKRAQDDGYILKKVNFQFLWDRTKDTNIPGHAALYSNEGRGQGLNYIETYLTNFHSDWDKIKNNEVYIWIKERDISRDLIGWELPIVIQSHAVNNAPELQGNDLELYTKYLKDLKPQPSQEIGIEQLIKMKLPKKLQKERLSKPIRLTKAKQQTERLFA